MKSRTINRDIIFGLGLLLTSLTYAQTINLEPTVDSLSYQKPDILEGSTGPDFRKSNPILIINQIVVRDSLKIKKFREDYSYSIKRLKSYGQEDALKIFGIKNEDGVHDIKTKRNVIIDL